MKNFKKMLPVILCISLFSALALGSGSTNTTNTSSTTQNSTDSVEKETTKANVETESESTTSSPEQASSQTDFYVGDTLSVNGLNISYVSSCNYISDNEFIQPADGNKFIRLAFHVDNQSDSDCSVSSFDFQCYADGYDCQASYQEDDLSASLSPGRNADGAVYFEVPTDAENIEIEYTLNWVSNDKVKFIFEGDKDSTLVFEKNTVATENAYHVGDVIETSKLRINYNKAAEYVSDNMFLTPADGMKYAYIELEVENLSDSDQTISYFSFTCYADGVSCNGFYGMDDALSSSLSPGRKAKGTIAFEVPKDAQVIEFEFEDNFWTENKLVFLYEEN